MRQRIYRYMAFLVVDVLLGLNLARAQSDIQPVFTPANSQKLDARSTPAKATSDDESALASKGYFKIGTISASQRGDPKNPTITGKLFGAILKKAAEAGGDVVHFTKEDAKDREYETDVSKFGKSDHARCFFYGNTIIGYDVLPGTVPPYRSYTKPIYKCEEWVVDIVVDEGTVWRYDPKLAPDIAARAGEARNRDDLMTMLYNGNLINAKALLDANPGLVNSRDIGRNGDTPLMDMASVGRMNAAELLLANGADVNAKDTKYGNTSLHEAASAGRKEMVELLLAHGADVNARDNSGDTPLCAAVSYPGYADVAELLMAHGADVNARDNSGMTPLNSAAYTENKEVVGLLLAHGADVNAIGNNGKTPLGSAEMMGYADVANLLRQHGANIAPKAEPEEARKAVTEEARKAEPEEARKAVTAISTAAFPMLGKDINSVEMKTWLSNLGTPKIDKNEYIISYTFKSRGVALVFDTKDKRLSSAHFYAEGQDGFRQFQGDLPYGLSFQLTRKEVESVLGPPDTSGGEVINYWARYSSRDMRITYNTMRTDDLNARISVISIVSP